MPYHISQNRETIARTILSNNKGLDEHLDGLTDLLKIDTTQSDADFLTQFRQLKEQHPIINNLCRPDTGGLFWRKGISYFFKNDTKKAERYKTIITQLKTGENTNHISYFGQNKKSVWSKIEETKTGLLKKTYSSKEDPKFIQDSKVFSELTNVNNHLAFKPNKVIAVSIQEINPSDTQIWEEFTKTNPEYSVLTKKNQLSDNTFNVEGKTCSLIKDELTAQLGLGNVLIFQENDTLNAVVGEKIQQQQQQQQQQAATIIQKNYKNHMDMNMKQATLDLKTLLSNPKIGKIVNSFHELQKGDIVVVANASYGLNPTNWEKHSYIAIKGDGNSFDKVYELGGLTMVANNTEVSSITISGEIPRKDNKALPGNMYVLTTSKHNTNLTNSFLSKFNHMAQKGSVFKLNASVGSVEFAYNKTIQDINYKQKKYLGAQYNCNHFTREIVLSARKYEETKSANQLPNI